MKKIISFVLLTIMIAGIFSFTHLASEKKKKKTEYLYSLAGLEPLPLEKRNYNNGYLLFSPDGKYLATASEKGELKVISLESKKVIYQKKFGIGFLRTLVFSADSSLLYLGESSPDCNIYCLALPQGQIVWRYNVGKEVGNNLALQSYPTVYRLVLNQKGNLYCLVGRGEHRGGKVYRYQSRIYAFNAQSGQMLWKFPTGENLKAKSNWVDSDSQGIIVAFNASGKVYCLDGQTGKRMWIYNPVSPPPFQENSAWFSPSVSSDGKHIGFLTGEGMLYFFNSQGKLLWQRQVSIPKEVNGIPLYAVGLKSYFQQNKFIVLTGNSYNAANSASKLVLEHPNNHSVFAYDYTGNLLWKWKGGGYLSEVKFTPDGKFMICPVSKNFRTMDFSTHGAYLLDISQADNGGIKMVKSFKAKTQGPIISADISQTGQYVAAWEVPVLMPDRATIKGKYQVHLWKVTK